MLLRDYMPRSFLETGQTGISILLLQGGSAKPFTLRFSRFSAFCTKLWC